MADPLYLNDPDALVWATYYCENEVFERLIAAGADVHCTNENGETPLHSASQEGWEHLVIRLLECGADPNRPNHEGDTPWDYAVFYRHQGVQVILERHGAVQQSRESVVQQRDDSIYDAFSTKDAVERLVRIIENTKTDTPSNSS